MRLHWRQSGSYVLSIAVTENYERTYIAPIIQIRAEIWIAVRRDKESAMKDELNAPTREPAGIEAVIPPWR